MVNKYLTNKFKQLSNEEGFLSANKLEQLLKELGLPVSRKNIKSLTNRKMVKEPIFEEGAKAEGNRFKYDIEAVKDMIAYLIAENVCGLHGVNSGSKQSIFRFAGETVNEFSGKDIRMYARLNSFAAASLFVPEESSEQERLDEVKRITKVLEKIILIMWFAKSIVKADQCEYAVSEVWNIARESAMTDGSVKRFAIRLLSDGDNGSNYVLETKEIIRKLPENSRADLLAWVEILMTFGAGIIVLRQEAEAYMKEKHGVDIKLDAGPMKLFALQRTLS